MRRYNVCMSDQFRAQLERNLQAIQQRIADATARSGRSTEEVTLIAVTKYAEWEWVCGLHELGVREFGESRPQQLIARKETPGNDGDAPMPDVRWHLIGHLQRNKVRAVLPSASLIHSVDSVRLLRRIDEIAGELNLKPQVLLEVNVSGEEAKDGFTPESLREEWSEVQKLSGLSIRGLMTMAPHTDDANQVRSVFSSLRQLRDDLRSDDVSWLLPELSMGMSGDFEIAIEEGATIVRVGSSLYEGL